MIHGGIDGYSRLIVYLNVALDNTAATAFAPFANACQEFGVPSRVRTDHGLENTDIGAFMIAHRGPDRGSIITGRSVHNQRIERLWRDMFQSCLCVFYQLFYFLERHNCLDVTNLTHLWCLHYIYKPRIKLALDVFRNGWNNHNLTTERGRTPRQLFVRGVLENAGQGHVGIDDLFVDNDLRNDQDIENYGIDWMGPVPEQDDSATVSVPRIVCPIQPIAFQQLQRDIDPLSDPHGLGIDLYLKTVEYCTRRQ